MAFLNNNSQLYLNTEEQGQIEFIANNNQRTITVLTNNNRSQQKQQLNECLEGYSLQEPAAITNLQLPPPNLSCYQEPPIPRGEIKYVRHDEPIITKTITQNFNALKTVIKENTIHHQHNKTVITNVNRNHWHTQRVVVKDNHFHHHLVNNVIKVNDVHHQKIEQVRGEGKTFNDFKQTQRVEGPVCLRDDTSPSNNNCDNNDNNSAQQQQYQQILIENSSNNSAQLASTINALISNSSSSDQNSQNNNLQNQSFLITEAERSGADNYY